MGMTLTPHEIDLQMLLRAPQNLKETPEIPPKRRRHLTYDCEPEPRQFYNARRVKAGCGRRAPHSTYRTESLPDNPWLATCPFCGKRSRMDLRNKTEHPSRPEAMAVCLKVNEERGF